MKPRLRLLARMTSSLSRVRAGVSLGVCLCVLASAPVAARGDAPGGVRVAAFQVDATPPLGTPLCHGSVEPAREIVTPLTARGVVLLGDVAPIVLCACDWVGIGNETHAVFREALAKAAGTSVERVALHTVHQHDAPGSDFATERLLGEHGLAGRFSAPAFERAVLERLVAAVAASLAEAREVTHIGLGTGTVEQVASNRRILGADGTVVLQRQSSGGRSPAAREAPEGTIDSLVRTIALWRGDEPLAVLTYYATHPQSYYGRGGVNWDFVGMAREMRSAALGGLPHVHFNGAGGNVAAGKYNDGAPANRPVLARRLEAGMRSAWETQRKVAIEPGALGWESLPVTLPVRDTLDEARLLAVLREPARPEPDRLRAARDLVFLRRVRAGERLAVQCLTLGPARVLHLPGELFVEYQLAAQRMRPDLFIATAAYGDIGPGYIGTAIAYGQGGYETGVVSRVGPGSERVLVEALQRLLSAEAAPWPPL